MRKLQTDPPTNTGTNILENAIEWLLGAVMALLGTLWALNRHEIKSIKTDVKENNDEIEQIKLKNVKYDMLVEKLGNAEVKEIHVSKSA